jgi:hypothetical protein
MTSEIEVSEIEQVLVRAFIEMGKADAMEHLQLLEKFYGIMHKHIGNR